MHEGGVVVHSPSIYLGSEIRQRYLRGQQTLYPKDQSFSKVGLCMQWHFLNDWPRNSKKKSHKSMRDARFRRLSLFITSFANYGNWIKRKNFRKVVRNTHDEESCAKFI